MIGNFEMITFHPEDSLGKHLLFLPGGAYILDPVSLHWSFIKKLVRDHQLTISLLNYPKAPEHTYRTTHEILQTAFTEIEKKYPDEEIQLIGDSAGGGLALALLQSLRDKNIHTRPQKTVLISPWLDLELKNPDIHPYVKRDYLLSLEGLHYAAKKYSGGEDLRNPLLSPLYGDLSELGQIMLLYGTEEIFYPDCQELEKRILQSPGTQGEVLIGDGLGHDWVLFPIRQSRSSIKDIVKFLNK
jgi:acetyl esterase/lipase